MLNLRNADEEVDKESLKHFIDCVDNEYCVVYNQECINKLNRQIYELRKEIKELKNDENVFPIENLEPKDVTLDEMLEDYDLTSDDIVILTRILYPNVKDRVNDYEKIIELCEKRIKELEKEETK